MKREQPCHDTQSQDGQHPKVDGRGHQIDLDGSSYRRPDPQRLPSPAWVACLPMSPLLACPTNALCLWYCASPSLPSHPTLPSLPPKCAQFGDKYISYARIQNANNNRRAMQTWRYGELLTVQIKLWPHPCPTTTLSPLPPSANASYCSL